MTAIVLAAELERLWPPYMNTPEAQAAAMLRKQAEAIEQIERENAELRKDAIEEAALNCDAAVKRAYAEGYERRDMEIKAAFA